MSGVKVSDYELQRAVAMRVESINQLRAGEEQRSALQRLIQQALNAAAPGLRDSFPDQVNQARSWLTECATPWNENWDGLSQAELNASLQKQQQRLQPGQQAYQKLNLAFTKQASALGQELSNGIADVESLFHGKSSLLGQWRGETQVQEWQAKLANLRTLLDSQSYRQLQSDLNAIQADLVKEIETVQALESKHQQRVLLLRSLRQLFYEMGFTEQGEPVFEQPGQRGSRIVYRVDTHNRGEIVFHLSLNGVRSDADMGQDHCFEEFDELSRKLQERFGIITAFEPENGQRPPPRLKVKGVVELPSGKDQERHA